MTRPFRGGSLLLWYLPRPSHNRPRRHAYQGTGNNSRRIDAPSATLIVGPRRAAWAGDGDIGPRGGSLTARFIDQ